VRRRENRSHFERRVCSPRRAPLDSISCSGYYTGSSAPGAERPVFGGAGRALATSAKKPRSKKTKKPGVSSRCQLVFQRPCVTIPSKSVLVGTRFHDEMPPEGPAAPAAPPGAPGPVEAPPGLVRARRPPPPQPAGRSGGEWVRGRRTSESPPPPPGLG